MHVITLISLWGKKNVQCAKRVRAASVIAVISRIL